MSSSTVDVALPSGQWPVDPQDDLPVSKDRIWVDGCFDFSHHGRVKFLLRHMLIG
jgi:ethanolamine-phosphate cytidylyltransferase